MIKTCLTFAFSMLLCGYAYSQDFVFGSLTSGDLKLAKSDLDSFSNAAVLNEYGKAYMVYDDTRGYTQLVVDYHVRIKVRSEEHTSELQSLMRISYAVFCLKKKQYKKKNTT